MQLGGYDPDTVRGTMWYVGSNDPEDFIVGATSLKVPLSAACSQDTRVTGLDRYGMSLWR